MRDARLARTLMDWKRVQRLCDAAADEDNSTSHGLAADTHIHCICPTLSDAERKSCVGSLSSQ